MFIKLNDKHVFHFTRYTVIAATIILFVQGLSCVLFCIAVRFKPIAMYFEHIHVYINNFDLYPRYSPVSYFAWCLVK